MTNSTVTDAPIVSGLNRRQTLGFMLAGAGVLISSPKIVWAQGAKPSLTLAIGTEPLTLDAGRVAGGADYLFFGNVFEGLYSHDIDGKLVPGLAERIDISEDGLTYSVSLRANAKFHNGDPVTSEDVRFSWQRGVDPKIRNPRASIILTNISDIEIVDNLHCTIKLKKPDASFLDNSDQYWYIVPKSYIAKVGDDGFAEKPVGTGPFSFVEFKIRNYIKLKGFDQHWGRVPAVSDVTMKIVPDDQTRLAQLQAGEVDIATSVSPVMTPLLKRLPTIKIESVPTFENIAIGINAAYSANPALHKVEVRQALNLAIDRNALVKSIMLNYGTISGPPCADGVEGCANGTVPGPYAYDPKKARAMLESAGFDFNRPLKYVALAPGRAPLSKEIGEATAGMLNKVGIKVELSVLDYGAWLAMYGAKAKDPNVDLFFSTLTDYNPDPSGRITRLFRTGGVFSWFSDAAIDAKLDRINNFVSVEERRKFIASIFTDLYNQAPQIFLWSTSAIYGMSKKIDWTPSRNVSWPLLWNVKKQA